MSAEYEIFYPNKYSDADREYLEYAQSIFSGHTGGLTSDGNSENEPPPFQNKPLIATQELILEQARKWNKLNPLYNSAEYAKGTQYGRMPIYPCTFEASNTIHYMIGSCPLGHNVSFDPDLAAPLGSAFSHEIEQFIPILEGDILTPDKSRNKAWLEDCTPEGGAPYRVFMSCSQSEYYNQRGELALRFFQRNGTALARYIDKDAEAEAMRTALDTPPKSCALSRKMHHYTDDDYARICDIWKAETIRGSSPLYWEDTHVGQWLPSTCDGPLTDMEMLRLDNERFIDMETLAVDPRKYIEQGRFDQLYRAENGMYFYSMNPHISGFLVDGGRAYNANTYGRNYILRMVTNWCGDNGLVSKVNWRMVWELDKKINRFPSSCKYPSFLYKVPGMAEKNRFAMYHGMAGDVAICHGYITNKYKENSVHYVELVCWAETIEGYITQECLITVQLPSASSR